MTTQAFYRIVLRLLVLIARQVYKGQYSSYDAHTIAEAQMMSEKTKNRK